MGADLFAAKEPSMKNPNMKYIEYHADDCSMGDTPPADCDKFRQWALVQIKREYPEYEITVSSKPALRETFTNDDERREEIELFCGRLWEACPWDWPQQDNESRAECECRMSRLDDVGHDGLSRKCGCGGFRPWRWRR